MKQVRTDAADRRMGGGEIIKLPMPGVENRFLGLRRKGPANTSRRPVLFVHGATFGSALFDLPQRGYSLMDVLAEPGRAVYALDVRGYGLSLGHDMMLALPERNPPFASAEEVLPDIAAAVDFILARHKAEALSLIGFSWGSITASQFAATAPHKVAGLALYAPLYCETGALALGKNSGAYRLITKLDVISRWDRDLPAGSATQFREDGIAEFLFDTVAAVDPQAILQVPPAFRCPNGALADLAAVAKGTPLFDPLKLTMPVLLVRGEQDTTSTDRDARALHAALGSSDKRYKVIGPGSHFLCIERNRETLHNEFDAFLGAY